MIRRFKVLLFMCFLSQSCVKGCLSKSSEQNAKVPEEQRVNLFIWGDYTSPEIFSAFERKTGIKVIESNFASNEELLAKLQAGAEGYDLIIPSDYMVAVMRQLDLLEPLNIAHIPNSKNVDPQLLHRNFDPDNKWSIPYSWAITGLVYNKSKLNGPISGYQDHFARQDIVHRYSILDDMREAIGGILKSQGKSVNTIDEKILALAKNRFIEVKRNMREFNTSPTALLEQGDLLAAQIYSNEALRLIAKNKNFEFVLPSDGFTMAIDNMSIPKASKNKSQATELINYLLDSEVNIAFATQLLTAPVVKGALEQLPEEMRKHPAIGQLSLIQSKSEMIQDIGKDINKYDRIWTEIKASN